MKKLFCLISLVVSISTYCQSTEAGKRQNDVFQSLQPSFFAIVVKDIEQSIEWYNNNLGFELANKTESKERGFVIANMTSSITQLELIELKGSMSLSEASKLSGASKLEGLFKIGFKTSFFDDYVQLLKKNNVNFHGDVVNDPNSGLRMVIIKDPDGTRIQLFEK
ncbi:VOC family protein [Ekhidna sp.]|uniref:VOC family protein n=1 Tax=Ekhidna sp. TaxID=2608089 RepID=UPI00329928AD